MKKVFVLGAGASQEFGLPTGPQLKQDISDLLRFGFADPLQPTGDFVMLGAFQTYRTALEWRPEALFSAAIKIRAGLPTAPSIDTFLETHADDSYLVLCGKLAIVRSILRYERNSVLNVNSSEPTFDLSVLGNRWYVPFFHRMTAGCTLSTIGARLSELGFVIFNYDRCFELYLFYAFMKRFVIGPIEAAELVNSMSIIHPYGTVGTLPFQNKADRTEFGKEPSPQDLIQLSRGIRTFTEIAPSEEGSDNNPMADFRELDLLAFIGFAFHDQNVDLVFSNSILIGSRGGSTADFRCFGSTFGESTHNQQVIESQIRSRIGSTKPVTLAPLKAYDFVNEYSRSL